MQGVEFSMEDNNIIPKGFDVICLPASDYFMFQEEPFEEENYCEAIRGVQHAMNCYDPVIICYE